MLERRAEPEVHTRRERISGSVSGTGNWERESWGLTTSIFFAPISFLAL